MYPIDTKNKNLFAVRGPIILKTGEQWKESIYPGSPSSFG